MTNVSEWDVAASNNTGSPPAGAPEGMLAAKVNDTMREMMAALSRWYQDCRMGSLVSASAVANAYTLTTNNAHAALSDIAVISFRVNAANTGAVTLNVDGLGAKTWQKRSGVAYASGDLVANQAVLVAYNATNDMFETVGGATGEFDSGHEGIKFNAAADNGWTKDTTANLNDTTLRMVTGTPTSRTDGVAASTVWALTATDGYTLASADIPGHTHDDGTLGVASHAHDMGIDKNGEHYQSIGASGDPQNPGSDNTGGASPNVTSGATGSTGGGGAHAHNIDLQVNYHDVIKQAKD